MGLDKPDSRKCGGCLEGSCSIQLSYGGFPVRIGPHGDEPPLTRSLLSARSRSRWSPRCSPSTPSYLSLRSRAEAGSDRPA
jgi:hypothetical protein